MLVKQNKSAKKVGIKKPAEKKGSTNRLSSNYQVHGEKLFNQLGNKGYLEYVFKGDEKQHNQVLALFCLMKGYIFNNYQEFNFFFTRFQGRAKELNGFTLDRIKNTIQYLIDLQEQGKINFKIGLETVQKYIMDVEYLEEEVIIRLKNGEAIIDTKRLMELEK
jgi:hypothetical protein